jgi:hypothetical protein
MRHKNHSIENDPPREKSDQDYVQAMLFDDTFDDRSKEPEMITKKQKIANKNRSKND